MVALAKHALYYAAHLYAKGGWHVFPITPGAKTPPLTTHGLLDATLDAVQIRRWWERWPQANVGIVTGKVSGITVIDLDGPEGVESFKAFGLPKTWTVKTPRGGYHLYFRYHPAFHTGAGFVEKVDCRNDGGYVVAEPSVVGGKQYKVVRQVVPLAEIGQVPDAFLQRTRRAGQHSVAAQRDSWITEALQGVPESQRNDTAARLAGYFHAKGFPEDIILSIMIPWAQRCSPPMNEYELARTVQSVTRYPSANDGIKGFGNEGDFIP